MGLFMHHERFLTHRQYFLGVITVQRHNTRLIHHYFIVMYYQGIRGTQVNSYFLRKPVKKSHVFYSDLPVYSISAGSEKTGRQVVAKLKEII
jgi:hypothetical protein